MKASKSGSRKVGSRTDAAGTRPEKPPERIGPPLGEELVKDRTSYLRACQKLLEDAQLSGRSADVRHYMTLIGRVAGFTDEIPPEDEVDPAKDKELAIRLAKKVGLKPEDLL